MCRSKPKFLHCLKTVKNIHDTQLSGQNETCPALMSVPSNYLEDGSIQTVGLIFAHGTNADDQRGPLFNALTNHFCKKGYLVMRYYCRQKEQRRQRIFERSADTAAHSPYAKHVKKWIFVGHENGARIAALIGYKAPLRPKHAFIFLSYPLLEPAPPPPKQKAGAEPPPDSTGPLIKLFEAIQVPMLFISGENDLNCPAKALKAFGDEHAAQPGVDLRAVVLPDVDAQFMRTDCKTSSRSLMGAVGTKEIELIINLMEKFVHAVANDAFTELDIPRIHQLTPSNEITDGPRVVLPGSPGDGEGRCTEGEQTGMQGNDVAHAVADKKEDAGATAGKLDTLDAQDVQAGLITAKQEDWACANPGMTVNVLDPNVKAAMETRTDG